jgi:hypothetical protein
LCGCTSYVEALAVLNDVKPSVVKANINLYVVNYIETIKFAGYSYDPTESILEKKVYFNKSGYIIPYDCVLTMLTGSKTDVKVVGDDEYHRVYHYDIKD